MSELTDLQETRANYIAQLKDMSTNRKTNYTIDGQTFNWIDYQKFLLESIKGLTESIKLLTDDDDPDWFVVQELATFVPGDIPPG